MDDTVLSLSPGSQPRLDPRPHSSESQIDETAIFVFGLPDDTASRTCRSTLVFVGGPGGSPAPAGAAPWSCASTPVRSRDGAHTLISESPYA